MPRSRERLINLILLGISIFFIVISFFQKDNCGIGNSRCAIEKTMPLKVKAILELKSPLTSLHLWNSELSSTKRLVLLTISILLFVVSILGLLIKIRIYFLLFCLFVLFLPYNLGYYFCFILLIFCLFFLMIGVFIKLKFSKRIGIYSLNSTKEIVFLFIGSFVAAFASHWSDFGVVLLTDSNLLLFSISLGAIILVSGLALTSICIFLENESEIYYLYFFPVMFKKSPSLNALDFKKGNETYILIDKHTFRKID